MKNIYIAALFLGLTATAFAQTGNVGINTSTPKSTLDVALPASYTNGSLAGVSVPQLTGDQIEAMTTTGLKAGTIVYATAVSTATTPDVNSIGYWFWKDATSKWEPLTSNGTTAGEWTFDGTNAINAVKATQAGDIAQIVNGKGYNFNLGSYDWANLTVPDGVGGTVKIWKANPKGTPFNILATSDTFPLTKVGNPYQGGKNADYGIMHLSHDDLLVKNTSVSGNEYSNQEYASKTISIDAIGVTSNVAGVLNQHALNAYNTIDTSTTANFNNVVGINQGASFYGTGNVSLLSGIVGRSTFSGSGTANNVVGAMFNSGSKGSVGNINMLDGASIISQHQGTGNVNLFRGAYIATDIPNTQSGLVKNDIITLTAKTDYHSTNTGNLSRLTGVVNEVKSNSAGSISDAMGVNSFGTITTKVTGAVKGLVSDYIYNNSTSGITLPEISGIYSVANNASKNNITNHIGATIVAWNAVAATGTVDNMVGLLLRNTNASGSTAAVTNRYGLKVEDIVGATNNYALYTGLGTVAIGGNVGIGTTTPTEKLEVSGTTKAASMILTKDTTVTVGGVCTKEGEIRYNGAQFTGCTNVSGSLKWVQLN